MCKKKKFTSDRPIVGSMSGLAKMSNLIVMKKSSSSASPPDACVVKDLELLVINASCLFLLQESTFEHITDMWKFLLRTHIFSHSSTFGTWTNGQSQKSKETPG